MEKAYFTIQDFNEKTRNKDTWMDRTIVKWILHKKQECGLDSSRIGTLVNMKMNLRVSWKARFTFSLYSLILLFQYSPSIYTNLLSIICIIYYLHILVFLKQLVD